MSAAAVLFTTAKVRSGQDKAFFAWQLEHSKAVGAFAGFVSSDIIPPTSGSDEWTLIQNFRSAEDLASWRSSAQREKVMALAQPFLDGAHADAVHQGGFGDNPGANVTEVIFSRVKPGMDEAYREWTVRIQAVQAKFPGYRGTYLQPPAAGKNRHWTTLLRYDNTAQLEAWMASSERAKLVEEARVFVETEDFVRLATSFPGWMPINQATGEADPSWKIACLVLLGLFPVVMLQKRFLAGPLSACGFSPPVEVFIGTVIGVALTSFGTGPLCVHWFRWWISPKTGKSLAVTLKGVLILACLFALEIALF